MTKKIFFLLFFTSLNIFGQQDSFKKLKAKDDLENFCYTLLDEFIANPTPNNLKNISEIPESLWRKPKTKPENLAIVIILCNRGFYEKQFGQLFNAIKSYEQASLIYQKNKLSNYDIIEYCLKPLGNLYTLTGDYTNAENCIKQYLFVAIKNKNNDQKVSAIINLSAVYKSVGKNNETIEIIEDALKTNDILPEKKLILYHNLASNYIIMNQLDQARSILEKSFAIEKSSYSYQNLAHIFRKQKAFNKAHDYLAKAKNNLIKSNSKNELSKIYLEEASLYFDENRIYEAKNTIQKLFQNDILNYKTTEIYPNKKQLYPNINLIDALDLLASIFHQKTDFINEIACYNLSFYVENQFHKVLFYESSKLVNYNNSRARAEKTIEAYTSLYLTTKNQKYLAEAFELQENTKFRTLKENLAFTSDKTNIKQQNLLLEIQTLENTILIEQQKESNAKIEVIYKAIKDQNLLMSQLKSYKNNTTNNYDKKIDLVQLKQKLKKEDATVVVCFFGNKKTYIFTVTPSDIKVNSFINSPENRNTITTYIDYFTNASKINNDIEGYKLTSFRLYKLLQLPQKSSKNLIVIPDGLLSFVSFESLLTNKTSQKKYSKLPYLLHDFTISYNTAISFYLDSKKPSFDKNTVLGIFPIFQNSQKELYFSKKELQNTQSVFAGKYLKNAEASFDHFKLNCHQYSILHLSTHAFSGDIQIPATISFYDKEVMYNELSALKINPNLVVLSACETGLGKLYKGEGAMSIARGFQNTGASNMLFSLWSINDFTTSKIIENFYSNLNKRLTYSEANTSSKIQFLNDVDIPNAKKSPYYWSAFVYYGALETNETHNYFWLWILGVILLFALVIWRRKIF
jgi:CHAT domain-containing protein/tetratricopeptide (TPR) repeat protein